MNMEDFERALRLTAWGHRRHSRNGHNNKKSKRFKGQKEKATHSHQEETSQIRNTERERNSPFGFNIIIPCSQNKYEKVRLVQCIIVMSVCSPLLNARLLKYKTAGHRHFCFSRRMACSLIYQFAN